MFRRPSGLYVICLTGGPGSGKTTVKDAVQEMFSDDVLVVPEAATFLLEGGFPPPGEDPDPEHLKIFQRTIWHLIIGMEQVHCLQAEAEGKHVVLCDRGRLDGIAYMGGDVDAFKFTVGEDRLDPHLAFYNQVIVLQSIATPHPELWQREAGNAVRMENDPAIAARIDRLTWEAWRDHPSAQLIDAEPNGLGHKVDAVTGLIRQILSGRLLEEE